MTTYEPEPPVEPVEPAEPTPEPEPDTEPEPEPEEPEEPQEEPIEPEPEPPTDATMKARIESLQKLEKHVARRMGEIFGDEAALWEECEVCSYTTTPGWRPQGPLLPDVASALWTLLGQRPPAELQKDPHSDPCDECGGEGSVATLSKVQGQESLPCVKCHNLGWLPTDDERKPKPDTVTNGVVPLYPPPSPDASALPAADEPDPPEVATLKAQGYTVIRPFVPTG